MNAGPSTFVDDDRTLRAALTPLRRKLLEALVEPASAAQLAERMDLPRQKIGYHLRALEVAGLVRLAETRRRRGFTERLLVAADFVVDPSLLIRKGDPDAVAAQDRHAADHLVRTASTLVTDVARMRRDAEAEGSRLLTLTVEAELSFARPADFDAFSDALAETVADLARRYAAPGGRRYRLVAGALPATPKPTPAKN